MNIYSSVEGLKKEFTILKLAGVTLEKSVTHFNLNSSYKLNYSFKYILTYGIYI